MNRTHKVDGHLTQEATVAEALNEWIPQPEQSQILELFGELDFEPEFDHKQSRHRR